MGEAHVSIFIPQSTAAVLYESDYYGCFFSKLPEGNGLQALYQNAGILDTDCS